jgi:hypothetical protein
MPNLSQRARTALKNALTDNSATNEIIAAIVTGPPDDAHLDVNETFTGFKVFTLNTVGPFLDKGGDVFSVKSYGAKGDDSTDDSTAILATFTAAYAAKGAVYFPHGTYRTTVPIVDLVYSTQAVRDFRVFGAGGGTIIKRTTDNPIVRVVGNDDTTTNLMVNWHWSDLKFQDSATGTPTTPLFDLKKVGIWRLDNIYTNGFPKLVYGHYVQDVQFHNCWFDGAGTSTSPLFDLSYDVDAPTTGLQSNQVHFYGCTWHTYHGTIVKTTWNSSSSTGNGHAFDMHFGNCKAEAGNGLTADVPIFDFDGCNRVDISQMVVTAVWYNSGVATPLTKIVRKSRCQQCSYRDFTITGYGATSACINIFYVYGTNDSANCYGNTWDGITVDANGVAPSNVTLGTVIFCDNTSGLSPGPSVARGISFNGSSANAPAHSSGADGNLATELTLSRKIRLQAGLANNAGTTTLDMTRVSLPFFNVSASGTFTGNQFFAFTPGFTQTTGSLQVGMAILPAVAQGGTASYTALQVNSVETTTGSGNHRLIDLQVGGASKFFVTAQGSTVHGSAVVANAAVDGFMYVPAVAGTPTGVPTSMTGTVPILFDSTAFKLWAYVGGAWKSATFA